MVKEQDILETFRLAVAEAEIKNAESRNLVPYSFRHYFITDRIKSGLTYARVAQISIIRESSNLTFIPPARSPCSAR